MINMKKMNKKQAGFTLIELVMVIVILGILSAFALPRFADLGADARRATVQGAFGAMKSASAITHSAWLAGGNAAATSVDLEGVTINITNEYPAGTTTNGIGDAAQLVAADYTLAAAAGTVTVTAQGVTAANVTTCRATYVQSAASSSPDITINVSNCN